MASRKIRVPIALLQQKVFPTSHRLEKFTPMEHPPKKPVVETPKGGIPTVSVKLPALKKSLFDLQPYLRRFFYLVDETDRVNCRACGKTAETMEQRGEHTTCYRPLSATLRRLMDEKRCCVCEEPLSVFIAETQFNAVPVCSESCLWTWDRMSPTMFDEELRVVVAVLSEPAKSIGNIRQFFGG